MIYRLNGARGEGAEDDDCGDTPGDRIRLSGGDMVWRVVRTRWYERNADTECLHTKSIGKLMFGDKSLWLSDPAGNKLLE